MKNNTLLIIDISKNYDFNEKNKHYVYLNNGNINLYNCKSIKLKNYLSLRKKNYKVLINEFKKFILNNYDSKFFLSEMEIFNLRNDRYSFPDRILNFLTIKHIISKKKINKIKIISDNKSTLKIFDHLNLRIEKKDLTYDKLKINFYNLKIIKFLIKSFFLVFFLKFFSKNKIKTSQDNSYYVSLYPNKYLYGKGELLYNQENICNFLLSDETHLNFNLRKLLFFAKITHGKNILNLEQFIGISDILSLLMKHFLNMVTFKKLKEFRVILKGLDFTSELNHFYLSSYVNRSKLEIYSKAIPRFLKKKNVKSINLYLFEYSFGFYLMRSIKEFSNKIKIFGYQHGIFSNNLMWFDLIKSLKYKKMYTPDRIYSSNKFSLRDYRSKYKNTKISLIINKKNKNKFDLIDKIKIRKKSNKILVLPGLHDIKDLYFYAKNSSILKKNKIFYFKLHPKNKFYFDSDIKIKKINNFDNKFFSYVIVSQDSSLHFDFLNFRRNFSVIDFDYKQNYISTYLNNDKKINFLKN